MSTAATTHTSVNANVAARATTWVANEVLRMFIQIITTRQLEIDTIHEDLDFYSKALRTWMTGQYLSSAILEVWNPRTRKVLERYDFVFDYRPVPMDEEERFETQLDRLLCELPGRRLPTNCRYRILLKKSRDAPMLPGWKAGQLRPADHLSRKSIGDVIDTAAVGVDVVVLS